MALIAHVNSRRVSEADVMAVPEPAFTETWHPVAHARVLKALEEAANKIEIGIRNSINKRFAIGLTAGTRVFVCDNA